METITLELPQGYEASEIRLLLKPKPKPKTKVDVRKRQKKPELDILSMYEELMGRARSED